MSVNEREQIGLMVSGMGIFYILFGISMMFDRALLACGNLFFIFGIIIAIGLKKTFDFFFHKSNIKGSIFLIGGVIFVIIKWPFIGIFFEFIGFILLFNKLLPIFIDVLQKLPYIGSLIQALRFVSPFSR